MTALFDSQEKLLVINNAHLIKCITYFNQGLKSKTYSFIDDKKFNSNQSIKINLHVFF